MLQQVKCARVRYYEASYEIDDEIRDLLGKLRKQALWGLCPYGRWHEARGTWVIFDRAYRPIVRIFPDGSTKIVRSDEFINYKQQRYFHLGFGSNPDAQTRAIVADLIVKYKLVPELQRRRELLRRKALPHWER